LKFDNLGVTVSYRSEHPATPLKALGLKRFGYGNDYLRHFVVENAS
jgi:hypothetical protein